MLHRGDRVRTPAVTKYNTHYESRDGYIIRLDNAVTVKFSDGTLGRYIEEELIPIEFESFEVTR